MMQPHPGSTVSSRLRVGWRLGKLSTVYALIWFLLAGSDPKSWIIGVPAILLAVAVSIFLSPGSGCSLNPVGTLLFLPHFVILSVMSGIDVMRRTFSLAPRINPGIFTYRTDLTGSARILLANIISLQPGTLSVDLKDDDKIIIHVLDTGMPARSNIRRLELRISRLFKQGPGA